MSAAFFFGALLLVVIFATSYLLLTFVQWCWQGRRDGERAEDQRRERARAERRLLDDLGPLSEDRETHDGWSKR